MGDGDSTADTETGFETGEISGDGDGDPGDGDGDPGDGDGDPNCEAPTLSCDGDECWASAPSWTAEARATVVDGIVTPGIWVPIGDLGTGGECWELYGVGTHVCIVDTCGTNLLGVPIDELALDLGSECDFSGAWESTASAGGECFGVVDGVAIQLKSPDLCSFPLGPCPNDDCGVDGRRSIADMDCGTDGCLGLWSGTNRWSGMVNADLLFGAPLVDPSTVWPCEPEPDADTCVKIDLQGHVGCFRIDGEFAVSVVPACSLSVQPGVDVGNGMCSPVN
jgi:hypothetical protein